MYVRDFVNKQYIRKSGPRFIRTSGCSAKNGLCFTGAFAHVLPRINLIRVTDGLYRDRIVGSVEMEVGREIVSNFLE